MIIQKKLSPVLIMFNVIIFSLTTQAQTNPYNEVSIASPTAASLGKYADIPVNYHTGIPDISVPVYTIKEGPLSLPISLSYHASGLKVMEPAGWAGAGWSLNAGGVITRTVRGAPDEKNTSSVYNQAYGYFSDYGWANYVTYDQGSPEGDEFIAGKRDGEPDLFSFNVGSFSGKFYFRDDRTPIFEPQQDVKVEYVYTGTGSIQSFVLTAPAGVKYYFGITTDGTDTDPVERTNPVTAQSGYTQGTVISSWYLNKIESQDSVFSIKLNYVPENYSYYTISMFPLDGTDFASYEYNLVKNVVNGVRLSSITFSNGEVDFIGSTVRQDISNSATAFTPETINTEAKALDAIQVTDNNGYCKKYVLSYSYFTDNTALQGYFSGYGITSDTKRLKLNSVQEQSCDGTQILPAHTFTYFTEKVPRRLSFGQDHWGFYNGGDNNTKLIPTYTENKFTQFTGANREPAWPAMRGGALKRIAYPTGGYSDFDYEANTTWASSTIYTNTYRFTMSVSSPTAQTLTQPQTLTGNPYKISLTNVGGGSSGGITIQGGSATFTATLNPGQTIDTIMQLDAGTYSVTITKSNIPVTGQGLSAAFYEMLPSTYQRNETVGGLRIKTLIHNDSVSIKNTITSYGYIDNNGHSTGILYSRPAYVQLIRNDELAEVGLGGPSGNGPPVNICNPNGCINCDWGTVLSHQKSPCGIRPLSTSQGNHIGYNEVKVSQTGNGYTIYRYYGSDKWDAILDDISIKDVNKKPPCNLSIPNYPFAPLPYETKRGQIKYEGYFNENGQLIKEAYHYYNYAEDSVTTPGRIAVFTGWKIGTYYDIKAVRKTSDSTVEHIYTPGGSYLTTKTETFFESPYHNQPVRSSTINSSGQILETKYKYTSDFRTTCDTISNCLANYLSKCAAIVAAYNQARAACTTDGCVYNTYQDYRDSLATARRAYTNCRRTNYTNSVSNFNNCLTNMKGGAGTELKPIFELQNSNQVTPIEVSAWRNSQLTSASFYKYDYSTNPASEVYINKTQAVNLAATSSTFTASANSSTAIIKDSRYEDEATYKFNLGNPVEAKGRDGITKSYVWDYKNNLPAASVVNAASDQIAFTSFEADGKGNWNNYTGIITTAATAVTMPPTGSKYYSLNTTTATLSKTGITNGKKYVVSYWSKNGVYNIIGGTNTYIIGKLINGWTYYEHTVTATAATITISGTGSIDEVRLYPSDAQMVTYTYKPLIGMLSQCDVNNRISYYEYDALGRLRVIKDQDKNVLKKFYYNYFGQQVVVDPPTNINITINNTSGATGFNVTYTNVGTSVQTSFNNVGSSGATGTLAAGIYTITVNRAAGNGPYSFKTCSLSTNCGLDLQNINVSAGSCNALVIELAD